MSTAVEEVSIPEVKLEQRKNQYQLAAEAAVITDQVSYEAAAQLCIGLATLRREIVDHHADSKTKAHAAWKAICAAENRLREPVDRAESIIKQKIGQYDLEQRKAREKSEREEREAAELAHAKELEEHIEQLEATGANVEEIRAVIAEPVVFAKPVAKVTQKVAGITTRELYRAEVTDIKLLAKAVAEGKVPVNLILPNTSALNALAQAQRGEMHKFVPGVKGVPVSSVATRKV